MSASASEWWRDTPVEIGRAFVRWNQMADELLQATQSWPSDPVERARIFDGLDLGEIAAAVDTATAALRLLPGMLSEDERAQ